MAAETLRLYFDWSLLEVLWRAFLRNRYGTLQALSVRWYGKADLFLTYCTNARAAARENPGQSVLPLRTAG